MDAVRLAELTLVALPWVCLVLRCFFRQDDHDP